jgi:CrcB protein
MIATLAQVALGGAIGASLRYLSGVAAIRMIGPGFPWATVFVNIVGSAIMGAIVVILAHKDATRLAPFLMTGILGGFTTFSAFSLDAMKMIEAGDTVRAGAYIMGTVVLALAAFVAGQMLARAAFV